MASGVDKLKDAMGLAVEPAITFAETGSAAASSWSLIGTILMTKILGPLSLISGGIMAMNGAMKLFLGRTEAAAKGIEKIRTLELIATQFQPLLGGAEAAKRRLEELFTFAASTPFQLTEIAEASRTLEVLTKGAYSSREALRVVGDAAAVSGQSMQTVAFWVGRTYDALKSGAPIGEATARLQEMGLITGDVRRKLQASAKAGESFAVTMGILQEALKSSEGGMEQLSQTLGGLESTLNDVRAKFQAGFAKDFAVAEKAQVKTMINVLQILQKPAEVIGSTFAMVTKALALFGEKITSALGGVKGLGNFLGNVTQILVDFAAAVIGVQFLVAVAGMTKMIQAAGGVAAAMQAMAISQVLAATRGQGLVVALQAIMTHMSGLTLLGKAQAAAGLALLGVFKALGAVIGMVAGAFKSALAVFAKYPFAWVLLGVIQFANLYKNIQESAKALKDLKAANDQARDSLASTVKSIENMDDAAGAIAKIGTMIEDARSKLEELNKQREEQSAFDIITGKGTAPLINEQRKEIMALREEQAKLETIDARRLQLGKATLAMLQRQVQLAKEMKSQTFQQEMSRAEDIEKPGIIRKRMIDLESELEVGKVAEKSSVAKELVNQIAGGAVNIDFSRIGLDGSGSEASIQSMIKDRQELRKRLDQERMQFDEEQAATPNRTLTTPDSIKILERDIEAKTQDIRNSVAVMLGSKKVDDGVVASLTDESGTVTDKSLINASQNLADKGVSTGLLAALEQALATRGDEFSANQRQNMELAIEKLKNAASNINEVTMSLADLQFQADELSFQNRQAFEVGGIEDRRRQGLRDIDPMGFEVDMKRLGVELKAAEERVALDEKGVTDAGRAKKKLEAEEEAIRAMPEGTEEEQAKKKLALEQNLLAQQQINAVLNEQKNKVKDIEKEIENLAKAIEEKIKKALEQLTLGGLSAEVDLALANNDFGAFFEAEKERRALQDKMEDDALRERMRQMGASEEQAEAAVKQQQENREKKREAERVAIRNLTADRFERADLGRKARDGDTNAANKLVALEARDAFRSSLKRNIEAGFSKEEAIGLANQDAQAVLLNNVKETKVVADSARKIGAGGFAGSTDPMKALQEQQVMFAKMMAKDIEKLVEIQEEQLSKKDDINIR